MNLRLFTILIVTLIVAACSQTPVPSERSSAAKIAPLPIIHVDKDATGANDGSSWIDAFVTLQDALECVDAGLCAGDEIWVAVGAAGAAGSPGEEGVYFPDERYDAGLGTVIDTDLQGESFFLVEGVAVYGGFDGVGAGGVGGAQEADRALRDIAANRTILSGDLLQDDTDPNGNGIIAFANDIVGANSEHVVRVNGLTDVFSDATILDGFFLTAGQGGVLGGGGLLAQGSAPDDCTPSFANLIFRGNSASNGGAMAHFSCNASLTNARFSGNEALSLGGAMYTYASDLIMTDVSFKNNRADFGGALYNNASDVTLSNPSLNKVTFEINTATTHGGAVHNANSTLSLSDITFLANSAGFHGGAIHNLSSNLSLTNAGFFGNSAAAGGGAVSNLINGNFTGTSDMTNVIFSGNNAFDGGAIYNENNIGSSYAIALMNATFNRNAASGAGGSIYTSAGMDVDIHNSILWGSTDAAGNNEINIAGGLVTLSYSDLQGLGGAGVSGVVANFTDVAGNLSAPPFFVDFDGPDAVIGTLDDDLNLLNGFFLSSPAIDAGDSAVVTAATDYEGNARIIGAAVDMGAYEQ